MARNESIDRTKNVQQETNTNDWRTSLLSSYDYETDDVHFVAESGIISTFNVLSDDFSKPLKYFYTNVSYDNVQDFFQDLGFNDVAIDGLKPYFSTLQNFVHYDVFAIIRRLEGDILADNKSAKTLSIQSQQDFFQALILFGFRDEWAQTYTWAMGKAYANQLVKHSIEECIRLRLLFSNTIQAFPDWPLDSRNNQWQTYNSLEFRGGNDFFVRKQTRQNLSDFGQNLNDIDFNDLVNRTRADNANPTYWFHATDWTSAESILRSGADRRGEHMDFSKGPAYYLNNDYRDCYEYLLKRNHEFNSQHAIFIYEFNLEKLSNGRYISIDQDTQADLKKWQKLVFSCINISLKEDKELHSCNCVFGWQCTNPNDVRQRKATHYTPERRTRLYDGQYAMQLAIRMGRMLTKVDDCLIGVVLFEHP